MKQYLTDLPRAIFRSLIARSAKRTAAAKGLSHRAAILKGSLGKSLKFERMRSRGCARGFVEPPHAFKILGVRAFPVSLRPRIHADRPDHADCLRDVVATQASGEDYGGADRLDDASADAPIVRHAQRADLLV